MCSSSWLMTRSLHQRFGVSIEGDGCPQGPRPGPDLLKDTVFKVDNNRKGETSNLLATRGHEELLTQSLTAPKLT